MEHRVFNLNVFAATFITFLCRIQVWRGSFGESIRCKTEIQMRHDSKILLIGIE